MKVIEDKVARRIDAAIQGYSVKTGQKLSWAGLAKEIGYTPQAPTKWKQGAINYKVIEKIAEFLGADPVWLTYGSPNEDEILASVGIGKSALTNPHLPEFDPNFNATEVDKLLMQRKQKNMDAIRNPEFISNIEIDSHYKKQLLKNIVGPDHSLKTIRKGATAIPVISFVQAGNFKEAIQQVPENYVFSFSECLSANSFALEIQGESMAPEFKPGDKIIIDPEVSPKPGDYVIAQNGDHEATFKKYRPRGYDSEGNVFFELTPLNPDYPVMNSTEQPIRIIGTVVEHVRALRRR